jgi:hypothetical protein
LIIGLAAVALAQNDPGGAPTAPSDPIGMLPDGEQIVDLRLVNRELPIPRNGSLLIVSRSGTAMASRPIVQMSRTSGTGITTSGGELRELGNYYWAWTPLAPLELGTYQLSLAHSAFGTVTEMVMIIEDAVLEPPAFTSNAIAGTASAPIEYAMCEVSTGLGPMPTTRFVTRERVQGKVFANLTLSGDPVVNNQFIYRAVAPGLNEMALSASNAAIVAEPFTEQAQEYCFGIEAIDITTGEALPYTGIEVCAPHGDLADFTERDVEASFESLNRFVCTVPPAGLEERWCSINSDCIGQWRMGAQAARADNCAEYFDTCPDAERPDAGGGGKTLDAGAAGSGGTDGRDAGLELGDAAVESDASEHEEGRARHGSGCAVARTASALRVTPIAWAAFALLALRRLRRRAPARRSR